MLERQQTNVAATDDHPLLQQADISPRLPNGEPDPGLVWLIGDVDDALAKITRAIARRQHPERELANTR